MPVTSSQLAELLSEHAVANGLAIVHAFNAVGHDPATGFDLAACVAVIVNESGGENVWGHDPWNPAAYPKGPAHPAGPAVDPVTHASYTAYRLLVDEGRQPQGCGPCQLTDPGLQRVADGYGGCWLPIHNCHAGFQFLRGLFTREGNPGAGFEAYNGSGPAAVAYAQRAVQEQAVWQARINALAGV